MMLRLVYSLVSEGQI